MAMRLKISSSDKKIHYKIFQKQNLNSFLFVYCDPRSKAVSLFGAVFWLLIRDSTQKDMNLKRTKNQETRDKNKKSYEFGVRSYEFSNLKPETENKNFSSLGSWFLALASR